MKAWLDDNDFHNLELRVVNFQESIEQTIEAVEVGVLTYTSFETNGNSIIWPNNEVNAPNNQKMSLKLSFENDTSDGAM